MGITGQNKPLQGDPLESAHAAVPAGAIDGELYVAAPIAPGPTVGVSGSGVVSLTDVKSHITFAIRNPVTDAILGETTSGTISSGVNPTNQVVDVSAIPVSPNDHVNCRRIYRDSGGGGTFRLVGEILDNITTTFTDNVLDTTSQPQMPTTNTTGQTITANVSTQTAFAAQELGTERWSVSAQGVQRKGVTSFAQPWGPDDIVAYFARLLSSAGGGETYTVPANEILVITSIVGSDGTGLGSLDIDGLAIATNTTASVEENYINSLPILVDAGSVLDSDTTPKWSVNGYRISKGSAGVVGVRIAPFIDNPVTTAIPVPSGKIRVILGISLIAASGHLEIEKSNDAGVYIGVTGEEESMCFDSGGESRAMNKVTHPIVLQVGDNYRVSSIGGTVWGYDIDV